MRKVAPLSNFQVVSLSTKDLVAHIHAHVSMGLTGNKWSGEFHALTQERLRRLSE